MRKHILPVGVLAAAAVTGAALVGTSAFATPVQQRPQQPQKADQAHRSETAAARARSAAAAAPADIDGDGHSDLVIGAPDATVKDHAKAGYLAVTYGSDHGVDIDRHQGVTQSHTGVPGTPEAGDKFGSTIAVGDMDGDGYTDVIAGASGEAIGDVKRAGSVTIVFGSASGVSGHSIAFHAAKPVTGQGFGSDLAVGDFDHDGRADLAVAAESKVDVVYGAADLRSTPTPEMTVLTPPGGGLGTDSLDGGDVDGDGYADLVTVAYSDDPADEGTLGVLPGSKSGLKGTGLGADIGLPFSGYETAVGDIDGDGKDDVVIDTGFTDGPDEFKLRTYPGTADGLDGQHPVDWTGAPQPGLAIALADLNGDGHDDLLIPDTDSADSDGISGAGSLTVLYGSDAWLTATGAQTYSLDTKGVLGVREGNDRFGSAIAPADYNGDGFCDLAVGVPGKYLRTGAVSMLYAGKSGLTPDGSILFTPETLGYPSVKSAFGAELSDPAPH